jgi:hypothetical protein
LQSIAVAEGRQRRWSARAVGAKNFDTASCQPHKLRLTERLSFITSTSTPIIDTHIDTHIAMTYHVARNNQQLGTFSKEDVAARYASGEILPADLVWTEGMANWQPASQVFGAPAVPPPLLAPAAGSVPPVVPTHTPAPLTPAYDPTPLPPKPDSYLVWAILSTLFCCLPLGIVSIVFAAQVDGKYTAGDYAGAAESSRKAKNFAIWGAIACIALLAIYLIAMFAFGLASGFAGAASGGSY